MSWTHRPALDGLRTVAVYLVLLFHAGIPQLSGGFLGVDLFFVLSGFLVSSIIVEELETTGRLQLGRFYARRIRRLLPAAIVVVVATSAVFVLLSSTVRRLPWVGDAQSALLYVANWRFLGQANDYFGADIDRSPFLHFWSLAIEEQFYFVFPLVLIGLIKLRRFWRPAVVVGVGVLLLASVAAQLYWAGRDLNHAYYGTDARFYQLMAGVLAALAWRALRERRTPRLPGLGWAFLALLLVVSSSAFDASASTRGLVGTVAATGLILCVMGETDRSLVWLLQRPTMTYLGRISYGTYLWHWPVILVLLAVVEVPAWTIAVLAFAISSSLAALSFEVFEHPIRAARALARFRWSTLVVGVATSALLAVTVVPSLLELDRPPALVSSASAAGQPGSEENSDGPVPKGLPWRSFTKDTGQSDTYCTLDDSTACLAHKGGSGLKVMFAGDSHSRVLAPTMKKLAEEHDFTLYYSVVGRCSWQNGVRHTGASASEADRCSKARGAMYGGLLQELDIDVVVLTQIQRVSGLAATDGSRLRGERLVEQSVRKSLAALTRMGVKSTVVLTALTPRLSIGNPLDCLSSATQLSQCRVSVPKVPPLLDSFYRTADVLSRDVATIDLNPLMCPAWPLCDALIDRQPVWRDSLHYLPSALADRSDGIWELLRSTGYFGT